MLEVVEVVDDDVGRRLALGLAVAERIEPQLEVGDLLLLGAVVRLEVDDDDLVGGLPPDQVDPAGDQDAVAELDLDRALGVLDVVEAGAARLDVGAQALDRRRGELALELRVGEAQVEVALD